MLVLEYVYIGSSIGKVGNTENKWKINVLLARKKGFFRTIIQEKWPII